MLGTLWTARASNALNTNTLTTLTQLARQVQTLNHIKAKEAIYF